MMMMIIIILFIHWLNTMNVEWRTILHALTHVAFEIYIFQ